MKGLTGEEREMLVGFLRGHLRHALDHFVETEELLDSVMQGGRHGGPSGHYAMTYDRRRVRLYRPSEAEIEAHQRYHAYCREHGYRGGPGCPPYPERRDGEWLEWSWAQIRRELQRADQLTLEVAA